MSGIIGTSSSRSKVIGRSKDTAKAWVNFDGTGTVAIRDSFNVSSITDNGAGDYYLNYTNNLANDDYAVSFGARFSSSGGNAFVRLSNTMSTSQTRILVKDLSDGTIDGETVTATVIGD